MKLENNKIKSVLFECIFSSGEILRNNFGKTHKIYSKTSEIDLVTEIDKKSEGMIIKTINKNFPEHNIVSEESEMQNRNSEYTWFIDPLDGTTNYAHNFPIFCVAMAVAKEQKIILSAIYIPFFNELFFAEKDKGAYLNKKRIHTSKTNKLIKSLLATGFPYDVRKTKQSNFNNFKNFSKRCQGVRRPGSASVDLAFVSCGRLDGFWEMKLKPWDIAAGMLLVKEAGGKVSNFHGGEVDILSGKILASNGKIHKQMQDVLRLSS